MGLLSSCTSFLLVTLFSFSSAVQNSSGCRSTCVALGDVLGDKVIFPNATTYSQFLESYYSEQESELAPSCIVLPSSVGEVSAFVRKLSSVNDLSNATCSFAIKGGGHAPAAGSANINNGITLSLSSINQVSLDDKTDIISIGSGATWGVVYDLLTPLGLTVSGARNSEVGVPGFLTGGGISFFTARTGFSCDQVVNFRVVLANGTVVDANTNTNSDLWIALRGGSINFGIVVRFDVRTFAQSDYLGGSVTYPISTVDDQVQALIDYLTPSGNKIPDPYLSVIMTFSYSEYGLLVSSNLAHTDSNSSLSNPPASIQPFLNIEPQEANTMRISNVSDFVIENTETASEIDGLRNMFSTATFQANATLMRDIIYFWNNTAAASLADVSTSLVSSGLTFEPISTAITSKSQPLGGDSLGLLPASGNLILVQLSLSWTSTSDDRNLVKAAESLMNQIDETAQLKGLGNGWKYLNYAASFQNPIASYGAQSVAHLEATSQTYDPTGFFQSVIPGGFKLPR